ncbi:MAG: glycosyltransferase family 39 protein [Candidatus Omnitrophica bacterium]|nr:glycosyltransferase family 39 protein [Candidatus Omnitrophota bacterium]
MNKPPRAHPLRIVLIILLIAGAVIRLVYLYHFRDSAFFNPYLMDKHDQKTFILWANQIKQHPWYVNGQPFYMAPLYPYFLALLLTLTGDNLASVLFIQLLFDLFTCYLLFLLGRQIGGVRTGIIAAGLGCFYRTFIVYSGTFLSDGLITWFYVGFITTALWASKNNRFFPWVLTGILLGLAILAKPTIALYFPFLLAGLVLSVYFKSETVLATNQQKKVPVERKSTGRLMISLRNFVGVVLFSSLAVLPVTWRNFSVSHQFVPICTNGPVNWAIGNSSDSLGLFCYPRGDLLSPLSLAFWKLQLTKTMLFFTSYEWPQNLNVYLLEQIIPVLKVAFVRFGLVVPLGMAGLFLLAFNWRRNFLFLTFTLTNIAWVILFFITDRYRLPAVACLMVSAAYCLVWTFDHIGKWKALACLWAGIGLFAYFFNTIPGPKIPDIYIKIFAGLSKKNVTQDLVDRNLKKAYREALTFVRLQPNSADAHFLMACVLEQLGHREAAIQALQRTLELDPHFNSASNFLQELKSLR